MRRIVAPALWPGRRRRSGRPILGGDEMRLGRHLAAAVLTASLLAGAAQAQPRAAAPAAAPARANTPSPVAILAMVRSTLLAIDHGNRTGNYTVVRDLAGPQFRDANSAAKLSQIFGPVVMQGADLLAVAVTEPVYNAPPRVNEQGMLHVSGVFRMQPRSVSFEILFEPVGGQWRLFAVGLLPV